MTFSAELFAVLAHLGPTRPVVELLGDAPDVVALRHDVDHDLDVALELAAWEHRRGQRATYFLLPTAAYWSSTGFAEKVRQLHDYGHEVGLHLNVLAEWTAGGVDVRARLDEELAVLRGCGVDVVGVSAHGDRLCYEHGFSNAWLLSDLRPDDPAALAGLSAEGVPSPTASFQLPAPPPDGILRVEGRVQPLWSVHLADAGLRYEAVHTAADAYYTDSGGRWTRSPDPRDHDLSRGRHQVLVHPEHWRGAPRQWFVLSTARSGSKWMATVLDAASSASADHEFTLNHRLEPDGSVRAEHRTGAGFVELQRRADEARQLIAEARAVRDDAGVDHVEANVYLAHFLDELRAVHPDAVLVHLRRDPREVVRSLLERDWYDTPEDDRHPVVDVRGWDGMSQLERCCWYVRRTNEVLVGACHLSIALEDATRDPGSLVDVWSRAGVAVHPRLLQPLVDQRVNAQRDRWLGSLADWSPDADATLAAILGKADADRTATAGTDGATAAFTAAFTVASEVTPIFDLSDGAARLAHLGCDVDVGGDQLRIRPHGDRHAHVLLGGGTWKRVSPDGGWVVSPGAYVRLGLDVAPLDGTATAFALSYDAGGDLVHTRRLGPLKEGRVTFAFRPRAHASRWNVALHVPRGGVDDALVVRSVAVEEIVARTVRSA